MQVIPALGIRGSRVEVSDGEERIRSLKSSLAKYWVPDQPEKNKILSEDEEEDKEEEKEKEEKENVVSKMLKTKMVKEIILQL